MKLKFKKWYRKSKGYLAFGLAILIFLYSSLVNFVMEGVQAEGANDRVSTFIKLAQGQSMSEDVNLEDLSQDELRFLGIYLSNFYIPFVTELGVSADNEETVQQMVDALSLNMDWDEDLCMLLCEHVLGLSRSNDKELFFYASNGYMDENYVKLENLSCNYYNFLRFMLGAGGDVVKGYCDYNVLSISEKDYNNLPDEEKIMYHKVSGMKRYVKLDDSVDPSIAGLIKGQYEYIYLGYEDLNGINLVCDMSFTGEEVTASQAVFRQVLESVNMREGYGFSFFDVTTEEIEKEDIYNSSLSDEELLSISIYNDKMYVDCFGNIIKKGEVHQYIAIPACMNPYVWTPVDLEGNDVMPAGVAYNVINFNSMSLADEEKLLIGGRWGDRSYALAQTLSKEERLQNFYNSEEYKVIKDDPYIKLGVQVLGEEYYFSTDFRIYILANHISVAFTIKDILEGRILISESSGLHSEDTGSNAIHLSSHPYITKDKLEATWNGFDYTTDAQAFLGSEEIGIDGYALRIVRGDSESELKGNSKWLTESDSESWAYSVEYVQDAFILSNPKDYSYYAAQDGIDASECVSMGEAFGSLFGGDEYDESKEVMARSSAIFIFSDGDKGFNSCYITEEGKVASHNSPDNRIFYLDGMVFIDNLGAYKYDNGGSLDYSTINFDNYLDSSGDSPNKLLESYSSDAGNGYLNTFSDMKAGKINTTINVSESAVCSVYTTYLIAALYKQDASSKANTIGKLGVRVNKEGLPSITNAPIEIPNEFEVEIIERQIRDWTYYLLHPTKGLDYVSLLIKNKTNALLVGWHNDMVGTNGVGAITGTTQYRSSIGFVTTPDLSEIQWTASLIGLYNKLIPFLIIAMLVVMLFSYVAGVLKFQKAIFGVIVFTIFLFMPTALINNAVGLSNSISQKIYGEKFTYWAIVQQESYSRNLDEAVNAETYSNYLRELYALNNQTYANQGGDSIVLKWQAPKKMASLIFTKEDNEMMSGLSDSALVSMVLNKDTMSGQYYLDADTTYMYRSYTDLGNFSRFIYNGLKKGFRPTYKYTNISNTSTALQESIDSLELNYRLDRQRGFANYNGTGGTSIDDTLRIVIPLSSNMYNDALACKGRIQDLTVNDYVGINQDIFNYSLSSFNNKDEKYSFESIILENVTPGNEVYIEEYLNNYSFVEEELSGLSAYALMSESNYYYFSWSLYDMGMSTVSGAKGNYKNLLLGQDNGGFFYNINNEDANSSVTVQGTKEYYGNGELKDFMDMKSLFTYIIPYLKEGNDIVREWDDVYGIFIYEGVPTEEGHQNDPDILASPELQQKYWHNLNVARLYNIYSPWVDLMYDCSYAQPETIRVMGEDYVINDPINPASYPEERPMIFSESEMAVYGLTEADLTEVERRILECNRQMEERMYELLNYYNFSDLTLNTSAAINCTFVFNSVFSETSVFGENINLYPQCFEINNFSYDAFLRFILANSLGEDLTNQDDFYMAVVQKSSLLTALMLIVSDVCSQFALPACKIFIIMIIFVSSILLILVTAFRVDPKHKFIPKLIKSLLTPMLSYLIINIGFAWILSLFMGTGNNAVTQSKQIVIQMGDPVIVLLIITALDLICIFLYWKIIKNVISDIKQNFSLVSSFVTGSVGGAFSKVGGFVSSKLPGARSKVGDSSSGSSYNETGTNKVSSRASQRGSIDIAEGKHEESSRINEAQRETYREDKSERKKKDSKEGTSRINRTIESGSKKIGSNKD